MMRPHLLAIIEGSASRVVWKAEDRLMARIASHFAGGKSCNGATCWMPALLTSTSSLPNLRRVVSIISAIESRLRHVGAGIVDANAVILGDAFARSFDLLRLAEAVQHYVRACAGERAGDAETDAAGRAGDRARLCLSPAAQLTRKTSSRRSSWRTLSENAPLNREQSVKEAHWVNLYTQS